MLGGGTDSDVEVGIDNIAVLPIVVEPDVEGFAAKGVFGVVVADGRFCVVGFFCVEIGKRIVVYLPSVGLEEFGGDGGLDGLALAETDGVDMVRVVGLVIAYLAALALGGDGLNTDDVASVGAEAGADVKGLDLGFFHC